MGKENKENISSEKYLENTFENSNKEKFYIETEKNFTPHRNINTLGKYDCYDYSLSFKTYAAVFPQSEKNKLLRDCNLKEVPREAWLVQSAPIHDETPKIRSDSDKQRIRDEILAYKKINERLDDSDFENKNENIRPSKHRRSKSCSGRLPRTNPNNGRKYESNRPKSCFTKTPCDEEYKNYTRQNSTLDRNIPYHSYDSIPKYSGYKPKDGICFIPFNKMFSKSNPSTNAPSRSSSLSSLCNTVLSVENTATKLDESDKQIIRKTRKSLKDRLDSANKKKNKPVENSKKVHLSIVVKHEIENHSSSSDLDANERSKNSNESKKKKVKRKKKNSCKIPKPLPPAVEIEPPPDEPVKSIPSTPTPIKVEVTDGSNNRRYSRKKLEIHTMVSQISPVSSDVEFCPRKLLEKEWEKRSVSPTSNNHQISSGGGNLLQTVINDLDGYQPVPHRVKSAKYVLCFNSF